MSRTTAPSTAIAVFCACGKRLGHVDVAERPGTFQPFDERWFAEMRPGGDRIHRDRWRSVKCPRCKHDLRPTNERLAPLVERAVALGVSFVQLAD